MQITQLLQRLQAGDRDALHAVMRMVYDELKRLARSHLRREMKGVSLDTTALVHEAYLKLAGGRHPSYQNRAHFYGVVSRLMRHVLVDAARARAAQKRSYGREVALDEIHDAGPQRSRSLLAMDDTLKRLEQADPLQGQLIEMRYFGGMTAEESSMVLSIPVHKVRREIRMAQAWLRREMAGGIPSDETSPPATDPTAARSS